MAARWGRSYLTAEGTMNILKEPRRPSSSDAARDALVHLLRRTAQGDHQAFSDFYHQTSGQVFGLVRRVLIDHELSEDVTQEVFIMVWQTSAKYNPIAGSPMAWLMTIAHRRAVDRVRSHHSSRDRDSRWAAYTENPASDEVSETVINALDAQNLHRSMVCLTPLQREAIVLAYLGCLTYREVAEKLSTPLPTIKSRIRNGLLRLRAELEPA
ncbi:ECF RNA polymerase sigma factor SigK [Arthrobacter sp. Hiyo4]|nr:ECF RNA polymerase sigma factor SigK [Arthrobacter sp. Hiyo4]